MTRYEYVQISVDKKANDQTKMLNRYAAEGWRVVHVTETQQATAYLLEREPRWDGPVTR